MLPIGQQGKRPTVTRLSNYTSSDEDKALSGNVHVSTTSKVAIAKTVNIPVENISVANYICTRGNRKRLKELLHCDDCDFDGTSWSVFNPKYNFDEVKTKIKEFSNGFLCKTVQFSDNSSWPKWMKFVLFEKKSIEVQLIEGEDNLKIQLVGPEEDVAPMYQYYQSQLEGANARITETKHLPSSFHCRLLERTSFYQNKHDALKIESKYSSNNASVCVQGPHDEVRKFIIEMSEKVQTITERQVRVDARIAEFLMSKDRSYNQLNSLLETAQVHALCKRVDQNFLYIMCFPDATEPAERLIATTYCCQQVGRMEDKEVQAFIRSAEYNKFARLTIENQSVMLRPVYDEIRKSDAPITLAITGKTLAVRMSTKVMEQFFDNNVIFTDQLDLSHPGFAKFLTLHKADDLNQLKESCRRYRPEINVTANAVIVKSTKAGLRKLVNEVESIVSTIAVETFDFRRRGLARFSNSSSFKQERSEIEKKHKTIVWKEGDEKDDITTRRGSSRRFIANRGITKQLLLECKVPNSCKSMSLFRGDLCSHISDAIVNAANDKLQHVGGLAKHIVHCAGKSVQEDCNRYIEKNNSLPTGNAMHTGSGNLRTTKHIIHTVGPKWPSQIGDTAATKQVEQQLQNAVCSSLNLAATLKCKTIAIPAISSGIFECPSDFVAKHIVQSVIAYFRENKTTLTEVHVVLLEKDTENIRCFKEFMKKNLIPSAEFLGDGQIVVPALQSGNELEMSQRNYNTKFFRSCGSSFKVCVKTGDIAREEVGVIQRDPKMFNKIDGFYS